MPLVPRPLRRAAHDVYVVHPTLGGDDPPSFECVVFRQLRMSIIDGTIMSSTLPRSTPWFG